MSGALDAVIIGGGISGLGCAKRLFEEKARFVLITDRLGGRMYHSVDGAMNFGATYVNEDYHHVLPYVGRQARLRAHEVCFQQGARVASLFDWRNWRWLGPLARLVRRLQELRPALAAFRHEAEWVPQDELRSRHPLVDRYARQPADELIDELGMRTLDARYAGLVFRSTAFAPPGESMALFYLASLLPLVTKTWIADFSRTYHRLTAGYQDRIVLDRVVGLERGVNTFEVHTAAGRAYPARNVVIAAPYQNARRFYPVPQPRRTTSATMLFVRGERKSIYQGKRVVVFAPARLGIASIWHQGYDWDQVYSLCEQPALAEVYSQHRILRSVTWQTAIVLPDARWTPLELEPGVFLIGDYNLCGLEDSSVTGLCAANRILRSRTPAAVYIPSTPSPSCFSTQYCRGRTWSVPWPDYRRQASRASSTPGCRWADWPHRSL